MTRPTAAARSHPRTIGWAGTTALAIGGSNQSLFLLGVLLIGQGTAAIPLLAVGLVLAWMAIPGWIELVSMWPDRVGGIAASCAEAFKPYSPVIANLTGVCYWWGWVPTCGLTSILSATAIHEWYLPWMPTRVLAALFVLLLTAVNLVGLRWVTRAAVIIGAASGLLAFLAAVIPVAAGRVDWHRASSFHLQLPFKGPFGALTSAMAGLYLIGFAAPAFEASTCHVGETRDFRRNVPRAVFASAALASVYFVVLPVVWLGLLGPGPLTGDLASSLGPAFAPLLGGAAKGAAIWFMVTNMFHGTIQPLAGASRCLAQLSEDELLPRSLAWRNRFDAPWVATVLTAAMSIAFLAFGDPPEVIAAANFTYLISIALPSVAVWLLRRHEPELERPWRAPRGTVTLGVVAAGGWGVTTVFGFEQFGLRYVLFGLALAYSGSLAYVWRKWRDRVRAGLPRTVRWSLHFKLTGAMIVVMCLDGTGYLMAVANARSSDPALVAVLQDIFVTVAILSIAVGLVLPGAISHATAAVTHAARGLAEGPLAELTRAMNALGSGHLEEARATPVVATVEVRAKDEVRVLADTFNAVQDQVALAARSLEGARIQLQNHQAGLEHLADHDTLTELLNRRRFDIELERAVAGGGDWALILFDLDNFKLVNDTRGHRVGDGVLRLVAEVLHRERREGDLIARLGGDEFAILAPGLTAQSGMARAEALVALIGRATSVTTVGAPIQVTASAGVVAIGGLRLGGGQLMAAADVALYEAKSLGRNRVELADLGGVATEAGDVGRLNWLPALSEALALDKFELYAQPIQDLRRATVRTYELLLRYVSVDGTVWAPASFLQLAERYGMITDIDRWVIGKAFAIARTWPHADFAVNLSGPSLGDPGILALVEGELAAGGVAPESMTFEITETAAISSMETARVFVERLKSRGCRFALDDFGAGFGSFHYLRNLPFDDLKIDGEFVRDITRSDRDRRVVQSILEVANSFDLKTIGECVEDEQTLLTLRLLGVDQAQGYHIARPGPVPEVMAAHPAPSVVVGR